MVDSTILVITGTGFTRAGESTATLEKCFTGFFRALTDTAALDVGNWAVDVFDLSLLVLVYFALIPGSLGIGGPKDWKTSS